MVFKVTIIGSTPDGRVDMCISTKSLDRVEYCRKFAYKNKYQFKVEMIDE